MTLACLLLFMGAMGKSAQFLLHTWLPDAMEGPTPVSALIHAATMVTAGVFMVARLSPLFEQAPSALTVVHRHRRDHRLLRRDRRPRAERHQARHRLFDLLAARLHVRGARRRRPIRLGIFHLFTHAFFKALLFLGAGSVIHAMHHEQDMRNMGGLRRIPFTFWMMMIGTLALTGLPLHRRAIFSKDAIIEAAYALDATGRTSSPSCARRSPR